LTLSKQWIQRHLLKLLFIDKGSFYLKDLGGGDGIYIKAEDKYVMNASKFKNQTKKNLGP